VISPRLLDPSCLLCLPPSLFPAPPFFFVSYNVVLCSLLFSLSSCCCCARRYLPVASREKTFLSSCEHNRVRTKNVRLLLLPSPLRLPACPIMCCVLCCSVTAVRHCGRTIPLSTCCCSALAVYLARSVVGWFVVVGPGPSTSFEFVPASPFCLFVSFLRL